MQHALYQFKTTSSPAASRNLAKACVCVLAEYVDDPDVLHDLDLMVTEACANVCRHAYDGAEGELEIRLDPGSGKTVRIEVLDRGRGLPQGRIEPGLPPPDAEGGRGLFIISRLADVLEVLHREGTNVLRMEKNIAS
jgi:anti-sigma regulatory factor (Ser/Thr protein kinase)